MLESAVAVFMYNYRALSCSACSVDWVRNSRQYRKNVSPLLLLVVSCIPWIINLRKVNVYTFLDLTSYVSLSEFELTMIVVSEPENITCRVRTHLRAIGIYHRDSVSPIIRGIV